MDVKISVIIPTFNRKNIISKSIDSVLNQNIAGIEVIVVDDGSRDDTVNFLRQKYSNVKIIELNGNFGCNIARNRGADAARGEWLLFLDSDDTLTDNSLVFLKELADSVKSGIIFSSCIDLNGNIMSKNPDFEGYVTYPEYICNKIKGEYLPMVKREVFLKCYFSEGTRRAPGIGHARVIKISKSAYFTKIITRIYDTTIADSITNTKSKTYNEMKQVWKIIIKEQGIDQLIHCPKCFIISILKYIYYSFGAIIRGNKN